MNFKVGERVWWKVSDAQTRRGIVRAAEERPGVQTDGETGLVYLDADQLNRIIPEQDGVYSGIDDISYHADHFSLSSSGARALLPPSAPAIFAHQRKEPPNPKPEYDFGHAAHYYVLAEGSVVVEVEADSWRTAAAKAAREEAWGADKVPLLSKDVAKAKAMAAAVREHPVAAALLDADGQAELSGYWTDPETGVRCRFRPDWLCDLHGRTICVDYKTAESAHPGAFSRAAAELGYHQQDAWYREGLAALSVGVDIPFLFIVQSKKPPFLTSVLRIHPEHVEIGRRRNREALDIYRRCTETGEWPGYSTGIETVELPSFRIYQQEQELTAA